MNRIQQIHDLGQSLWYDNIERRALDNGKLAQLIEQGDIRGITSNPSIFQKAIGSSNDYDQALVPMAWAGWEPAQIFDRLAIEDIRRAADLFLPLYKSTNGGDGFVSIEVNPLLANSTEQTISEAQRLWKAVDHPNTMIKIPATKEGIPAIARSIADGININITLIFSLARYEEVMEAYLSGLEERTKNGLPIDQIASVASFFVSRVDTKVDPQLEKIITAESSQAEEAGKLLGKAAIANANLAYARFREVFSGKRFKNLEARGARLQRPLWASTSTKNKAYRDVLYVEDLIAPDTVNTVPPATLDAVRDHAEARIAINSPDKSRQELAALEKLGISMEQVTHELEVEGVEAFSEAFRSLLQTIEERANDARAELAGLAPAVKARATAWREEHFARRFWEKDATLWTDDPEGQNEVKQRMGWLTSPTDEVKLAGDYARLAATCVQEGYEKALLLGMGGSSMAPEVFQAITNAYPELRGKSGLTLQILDSTDPDQILLIEKQQPPQKTLYIVSSKSGTTSEVNTLLAYFWDKANQALGSQAGSHFVAITDPGTPLEAKARSLGFRQVFHGNPEIGGRYSALSAFGLAPAALIGVDIQKILASAQVMAGQCGAEMSAGQNPGFMLGAVIGEAALAGKNKLILLTDPEWAAFGAWLEQLVAESSGKQDKGILPVDQEPEVSPTKYGHDRLFVYLCANGSQEERVNSLRKAGHPAVTLAIKDATELGAEYYRWCMAVAAACSILGVNAFDQPDVQDSKTRTTKKIDAYQNSEKLDEGNPVWSKDGMQVFTSNLGGITDFHSASEAVSKFAAAAKPGGYIAINAYLPRTAEMTTDLQTLRKQILEISGVPVTLGFGPRFLHSTGQLHKGGPEGGLFLEITRDLVDDLPIPGQSLTFGILEKAQALGDYEALQSRNRQAMRIHLGHADMKSLLGS